MCGRFAAWHACDVVRAIGGTLTLLHVLEYSAFRLPELEAAQGATAQHAETRRREARYQETQFQDAWALLRQIGLSARRPPNLLIVPALGAPILNGPAPYGSAPGGVRPPS